MDKQIDVELGSKISNLLCKFFNKMNDLSETKENREDVLNSCVNEICDLVDIKKDNEG